MCLAGPPRESTRYTYTAAAAISNLAPILAPPNLHNAHSEWILAETFPLLTLTNPHPTFVQVHSFGDIVKDSRFCTDPRYLFAQDFTTTRTVKLCLLPTTTATTSDSSMSVDGSSGVGGESNGHDDTAGFFHTSTTRAPFVNVEFTNTILLETADTSSSSSSSSSSSVPRPLFRVTIEGGTVVADSHEGPRAVWELVLARTPQVLRCLGSKLRRCRAVFNRLCISPLVIDFLEPHPLNVAGAADYYRTIAAPMWMKEIHSRLKHGSYDNEFDFAWDMRLVRHNTNSNATEPNIPFPSCGWHTNTRTHPYPT